MHWPKTRLNCFTPIFELALVAKDAPGHVLVGEDLRLHGQEPARRVAEVDHRQPVLDGDLKTADDLLHRQRIPGTALDGGVVGVDDHLAARNDADAGDDRRARALAAIGHVAGQRGKLQERRARIKQLLNPLPRHHLALLRQALDIAVRPDMPRGFLSLPQFGGKPAIVGRVRAERGVRRAQGGLNTSHSADPPARPAARLDPAAHA